MSDTGIRSFARKMTTWRPKNLEESLLPLMTLRALVGHGLFYCSLGKSALRFSTFYAITVSSVYLLSLYYAFDKVSHADWFHAEEQTAMYVNFINTAIWAFAGIFSWRNRKRYIETVNKVAIIDESLNYLGEPCDYNGQFRFGVQSLVVCFVGIFVATAIDFWWMNGNTSFGEAIFLSAVHHYPIHVNTIFTFSLAVSIGLIKIRVVKMNNILEKLSLKSAGLDSNTWKLPWRNNSGSSGSLRRISVLSPRNTCEIDKRLVQIIKHMHLEICGIPKEIERSYGMPIVLEMAANFVTLIGLLLNIYRFLAEQSQPQWLARLSILTFWFVVYSMKLIFINWSCARLVEEVQRTVKIIHDLRVPDNEVTLKDEIRQFSLQIKINPVSISPAGMFTLNNKFVTKFFATMITYLVILIEMSEMPLARSR